MRTLLRRGILVLIEAVGPGIDPADLALVRRLVDQRLALLPAEDRPDGRALDRVTEGVMRLLVSFRLWGAQANTPETTVKRALKAGAVVRGHLVRVAFEASGNSWGEWDGSETIRISPDLPWAQQCVVLLHELLHAADDLTSPDGTRISHNAIAMAAPHLLEALAERALFPIAVKDVREAADALRSAAARGIEPARRSVR